MRIRTVFLGAAAVAASATGALAERGTDGQVNIIYSQAPSTLNPYLSGGAKDMQAASLVIEPLARYDEQGNIVPYLVDEIPTLENGGISSDMTSITWHITPGLKWSDGTPFTSADVKFTAEYCLNPDGGCAQAAKFTGVSSVETPDDLTAIIHFDAPKSMPYGPFVGGQSPVLQASQFKDCTGTAALSCTEANFHPIGTGPFRVTEFKTNDAVMMEANPEYRDPAKPAFAALNLKGGGDAAAAGRAVLETGEYDYAWNLQLPPDVLGQMESAGKGAVIVAFGAIVERLEMNQTDPSPDLPEGERSTMAHPHPILTDEKVRRALSMAIDRDLLAEIGYGTAARATCNLVPSPERFASTDNTGCLAQDMDGARALLDEAGWMPGADGIREKDGRRLSLLFQTSVNQVRQDHQALIKQWWSDIGIETELKAVPPQILFGGDPQSPDTLQKFYADIQMFAYSFDGTDPESYLAEKLCKNIPSPENQWQGNNIPRYCDETYQDLVAELSQTAAPERRSELARTLNDMLTRDSMISVPLLDRGRVSGRSNSLGGVILNPWDTELWNAADWYRIKE